MNAPLNDHTGSRGEFPKRNRGRWEGMDLRALGKIVTDWIVKGRIHPEDLERYGQRCSPGDARYLGEQIWQEWRRKIVRTDTHPKKRYLAAFLRGYTASGWLPEGMAKYLADRLDPEVPEPAKQGGRLPKRSADYGREADRDLATAIEVLRCAGYPVGQDIDPPKLEGPQDDAVKRAAQKVNRNTVVVYIAYCQNRHGAALHLLFSDNPMSEKDPAASD